MTGKPSVCHFFAGRSRAAFTMSAAVRPYFASNSSGLPDSAKVSLMPTKAHRHGMLPGRRHGHRAAEPAVQQMLLGDDDAARLLGGRQRPPRHRAA